MMRTGYYVCMYRRVDPRENVDRWPGVSVLTNFVPLGATETCRRGTLNATDADGKPAADEDFNQFVSSRRSHNFDLMKADMREIFL